MGKLLRKFERMREGTPRIAIFIGRVSNSLIQPIHQLEDSLPGIDVFDARTANFDDNDPSWVSLFMDEETAIAGEQHGRVYTPRQRQIEVMNDLKEGRYDLAIFVHSEAGEKLASRVLHSSMMHNALNVHTGRFLDPQRHPLRVMHISNITGLRRSDRISFDHFGPLFEPIGIAQRLKDLRNNGVDYFVDVGGHSYEDMYWAEQIFGPDSWFALSLYSTLADTVLNHPAIYNCFASFLETGNVNAHVFDGGRKWLDNGHYQRSIDLGLAFSFAMRHHTPEQILSVLGEMREHDIADLERDFLLSQHWGIHDKLRKSGTNVESKGIYWGSFSNKLAIGIDDVTATGSTQAGWARESIAAGASATLPVIGHATSTAFKVGSERLGFQHSLPWLMSLKHPNDPTRYLFPKVVFSDSVPWSANDHQAGFVDLFNHYGMQDGTAVSNEIQDRCRDDIIVTSIADTLCGFIRDVYGDIALTWNGVQSGYDLDSLPRGYPERIDPLAARFSHLVKGVEPIHLKAGYDAYRPYSGLDLANPQRLPSRDITYRARPSGSVHPG